MEKKKKGRFTRRTAAFLICICLCVGSIYPAFAYYMEGTAEPTGESALYEEETDSGGYENTAGTGEGLEESVDVPIEIPDEFPGEAPEETPEDVPEETPENTPEVTPETIPEETPEAAPENTPEVTPEETPQATPEETPEATPETVPETTPETVPETTPETAPEETPEAAPEETPGAVPEEVPDESEPKISLKRSVVFAEDGTLRLRYELIPEYDEHKELVSLFGVTAVLPEGQVWDADISDPDEKAGFVEIHKDIKEDEELWNYYIGNFLDEIAEKDIFTSAVAWTPKEDEAVPESFIYYTSVPEGILITEQIAPVLFLSDGNILPYDQETPWENGDLLLQEADPEEDYPLNDMLPEDPMIVVPEIPAEDPGESLPEESVPDDGEAENKPEDPSEEQNAPEILPSRITVSAPDDQDVFCTFNYEFVYPEGADTASLPEPTGAFTLSGGEEKVFDGIPTGTVYTVSLMLQGTEAYKQTSWTGTLGADGCFIQPESLISDGAVSAEPVEYTVETDGISFTVKTAGLPQNSELHADSVTDAWAETADAAYPESRYLLYDIYFTDEQGGRTDPGSPFTVYMDTKEPFEISEEYFQSAFAVKDGKIIIPGHTWVTNNLLQIEMEGPGTAGPALLPDRITDSEYQQTYETAGVYFKAPEMQEALPEGSAIYAVRYEDGSEEQMWTDTKLREALSPEESQEMHFMPFDVWFSDGEQRLEPSSPVDVHVIFPNDPFGDIEYEDEFDRSAVIIDESGNVKDADFSWVSDTEMIIKLAENAVVVPFMISEKGSGMTSDEIMLLDKDTAGAAMEIDADTGDNRGRFWSFDVYYVNGRNGDHDTFADEDFSLKYQMEFHTSKEIPANGVKITIPASLTKTRSGGSILPSQIAVPVVSGPGQSTETRVSPFNCYYSGENLVFFNYKAIEASSNASWQVVYSNVDIFQIKDQQDWSLQANCTLDYTPEACQYRAAIAEKPCNHKHTDDNGACGYVEAKEAVPCDSRCRELAEEMDPADPNYGRYAMLRDDEGHWNHRHLGTCAYRPGTGAMPCKHQHNETCGYAPAVPGHECTLDCVDTNGDGAVDHVTNPEPVKESYDPEPLRGYVDTRATLLSVDKEAYVQAGSSYTPGLYTESQLHNYVSGNIDTKFTGANFKNYRFVVWKVTAKGQGTQPADLWIKDTPKGTYSEEIVGYKNISLTDGSKSRYDSALQSALTGYKNAGEITSRSWKKEFFVVVAYPASKLSVGQEVENTVDIELVPYDLIDEAQNKSDSAQWTWRDYEWHYSGDVIGITKSGPGKSEGWVEIYKAAAGGKNINVPDFSFTTTSINRSFKLTHNVPEEGSSGLGERIPGAAVRTVTVDDAVYAFFPEISSLSTGEMLTSEDYWFSSVTVSQRDTGYDVWEDRSGPVETATEEDNIDQGLTIYAMFSEEGKDGKSADQWQKVGYVEWPKTINGNSVTLTYRFTSADIARHPYRVMAVHEGICYDTFCTINVSLHINPKSPRMKAAIDSDEDFRSVQFENVSGVFGQMLNKGMPNDGIGTDPYFKGTTSSQNGYYQDQFGASFNWSEPGLIDFSNKLYSNVLPMRDSAFAYGNAVEHHAEAWKGGKLTNDVVYGRTDVTYSITMNEGYKVGSQAIASLLLEAGVPAPNRKGIVIYDLLPSGMNFDPSYPVTAGRLKSTNSHSSTSWDTSDMEVTCETLDINWQNSGRTMLRFTLKYTGSGVMYRTARDSEAIDDTWDLFQGWGISFQGYWDWEDLSISDLTQNIAAFMTSEGDDQAFIADKSDGVEKDNGQHSNKNFEYFISDLDGDSSTEDEMLMVQAIISEEVAMATQSSLVKTVRADNDKYYHYGDSAVVSPGGTYTYDLTLTNPSKALSDVVIFDRLEHAAVDRKDVPGDIPFESTYWTGTFLGVVTEALDAKTGLKDKYTVWYNANDAANDHIPAMDAAGNGQEVLTAANGWYKASEWGGSGKELSTVKAVAVSLGDYQLQPMESVSFQILMSAPSDTQGVTWAYNNGSFSSKVVETGTYKTEACNSVKVRTGDSSQMAIEKVYENTENIPDGMRNTEFEIQLWDTKSDPDDRAKWIPYSYHVYTLWNKSADGSWTQVPGTKATDDNGTVYLKAGQKAVFDDVPDPERIKAEETPDPFWKSTVTSQTEEDGVFTWKVSNEAKTVLYIEKKISGHAADGRDFEFLLETEEEDGSYKPAANATIWIVDRAYTDGRRPNKISEKTTDGQGKFTLKANETAAVIGSGHFNKHYRVTETNTGDDWIILESEKTRNGVFTPNGKHETFTNYWRWKDLYITKKITNRSAEDAANDEFGFMVEEITQVDGKSVRTPVSGKRWSLAATGESGILPEAGDFICHAAKGIIKIEGLEALKTYRITEIITGQFYEPVNKGVVEFTMSLYSDTARETITNDWLKRPLEVSKALIYNPDNPADIQNVKDAQFTFTVTCDQDGRGVQTPLKNYAYSIKSGGQVVSSGTTDDNGSFKLKGGQTAVFKDAGVVGSKFTVTETDKGTWKQIVPTNDAPAEGEMNNSGGKAEFVNGSPGSLMISKEWAGTDEDGKAFVEAGKAGTDPDLSVEISMKINGAEWPTKNVNVSVIDSTGTLHIAGSTGAGTWEAGKPYALKTGETIIISGADLGTGDISYEITESAYDRRHIEYWNGKHIQVQQTVPENGKTLKGTVKDSPSALLANEASGIPEASRIAKRFTDPTMFAPDGARLRLIVEKYSDSAKAWLPAENVPYFLGSGTGLGYGTGSDYVYISDRVEYTDRDGKLWLTAKENMMPWVIFTENKVYAVDVSGDPADGDMRVRELLDESDPVWGKPAGLGAITTDDSWTADPAERNWNKDDKVTEAFVNTTDERFVPVQVGKIVDGEGNETFTFILSQITEVDSSAASTGITKESIKKTEPGSAIEFKVYSKSTGEFLREGITNEDGTFELKAGEYAELQLPEKTLWTVSEDVPTGYVLEDLKEFFELSESTEEGAGKPSEKLDVLAPNLLLIGADGKFNEERKYTIILDCDGGHLVDVPEGFVEGPEGVYSKGMLGPEDTIILPEATAE